MVYGIINVEKKLNSKLHSRPRFFDTLKRSVRGSLMYPPFVDSDHQCPCLFNNLFGIHLTTEAVAPSDCRLCCPCSLCCLEHVCCKRVCEIFLLFDITKRFTTITHLVTTVRFRKGTKHIKK